MAKKYLCENIMHDIIAILVLAALFYLKWRGIDSVIDAMIALVVGFYFGKRILK